MSSYHHKKWACPFYQSDMKLCVHCERGSRVRFPDLSAENDYADRHCASATGWKDCSIAKSLLKFYERTIQTNETNEANEG